MIVGVGGIGASAIVAVGGIVTGRVAEGAGRGVGVGRGLEDRVEIEVLGRDDRNVLMHSGVLFVSRNLWIGEKVAEQIPLQY